jgi:rod shape-determining protein MreD
VTAGLILALLAGFFTLQVCLPPAYLPLDLLLLYTVFIGLYRGGWGGTWTGLIAGFAMDLMAGPPDALGLMTVSKGLVGFAADTLSRQTRWESPVTQMLGLLGLSLGHDLLLMSGGRLLGLNQGGLAAVLFGYVLPKAAVHCLLAPFFFAALSRLVRRRVIQNKLSQSPRMIRSLPQGPSGGWN